MKNYKPTQSSDGKILKSFSETEDELQDVCFRLLSTQPFYGHVLTNLNRVLVDKEKAVEAAVISPLNLATVKLEFNYKLWAPLSFVEKTERIKHELIHFVFLHPWLEKPKDRGLFYIACDLAANMHTEDKTTLRIENFNSLLTKYGLSISDEDGYMSIYNSLVDMYEQIPRKMLKNLNNDVTKFEEEAAKWTEKAMRGEFMEPGTEDLTEAIIFLPKNSTGNANGSGAFSVSRSMQAGGATPEEIQEAMKDFLEQNPDPWGDVKEGTAEASAKDLVSRILKDSRNSGTLPGELSSYVDLLLAPPKIDWRKELRAFTNRAGNVVLKSTMTRRSKRWGTFPASKIKKTQRIAVAVDTSGSFSEDEFQQAMSEIAGALQENCQIILIQADCQVDDVKIYDKKLPSLTRVKRFGNGGTSFDDALLYCKTQGKLDIHQSRNLPSIGKVDGFIYITDGWAPAPDYENYPKGRVLWLTTQKEVSTMKEEGFRGVILKLDVDDVA